MLKKLKLPKITKKTEITPYYIWQHWIRAFSIVVLIITGFYIGYPFISSTPNANPTNFLNALFRSWHIIFGFVLIGVIIFKSYLFLFGKRHSNERAAIADMLNPKIWLQQIGYYLLISKHPKVKGIYNPLQFSAYAGFYLTMFFMILTGLMMYVHDYHNGFSALLYPILRSLEPLFGGLANVRYIHHILMWPTIIFILGHIYMAVYNAIFREEGGMDTIFTGLKWKKDSE